MPDPTRYQFLIEGQVSERVAAAFPDLRCVHSATGLTSIFGPVRDHAAMRAILARIDSMGLNLVELRQLPD